MKSYYLFILIVVFAIAQISSAQIPKTISYQGILSEAGAKVDGEKTITFKLYETESGGTALWDNYKILQVKNGVFEVVLGAEKPLNLPFDKPYWLGIKVGAGSELAPRIPLTSAAYSLNAQSVADGAVSAKKIADEVVVRSINKIKDNVVLKGGNNITVSSADSTITISANVTQMNPNSLDKAYDQGGSGAGRTITADAGAVNIAGNGGLTVNGNVGIGTTNPAQKLDVKGTVQMNGFKMPTGAANGYVLQSDANGVGTWKPAASSGIGGSGTVNYLPRFNGSASLTNSQLYQYNNRIGVGLTNPYAKLQVHSNENMSGSGYSTHVIHSEFSGTGNFHPAAYYGKAMPANGYGYGALLYGGNIGAYAEGVGGSYSSSAVYGMYGKATGSSNVGTRIGVYGYASGGKTNWAGYFGGNVRISGDADLSKDAVEAYEIEDEPGIVQGMRTGYVTLTSSSTMQDIVTVTITIPASGYIVLNGRTQFEFNGSTLSQGGHLQIDETSGGGILTGHYAAVYANQFLSTGYYSHNCTAQRTYYKNKGTYTFRLEAKRITNNGTTKCWQSILTAAYFPTSYGSVVSNNASETIEKTGSNPGNGPNIVSESILTDLRSLEVKALKEREEAERSEAALLKAQLQMMEENISKEKEQN